MADYYLGVDIGNTKSLAVITDADGHGLGIGKAGCGNHEAIGEAGFTAVLNTIVAKAVAQAGIDRNAIRGAGFGVAGCDWDSDAVMMDRAVATLGLTCPYSVVNDCVIGLIAGASDGWGVVLSSGTSGNARGRDRHGREGRMTGNGLTFGEAGGGHEFVDYALAAISRAWSKRAPETLLSELFVQHVGATDVTDLLEGLARGRYAVKATDAPVVFEAVNRGDAVALDALHFVADSLADLALGIINQLNLHNEAFEVVLSASFYNGSPRIAERIARTVHAVAPHARLVRLAAPPVAGGVLLGMEQAFTPTTPVRDAVRSACTMLLEGLQDG